MKRYAVILAAGQGTRMKSKLYKVLHPVCGKPMIEQILGQVNKLGMSKTVTIVGHGAEQVKLVLGDRSEYVLQAEQLGTAHAVKQAAPLLASEDGVTIVVCGDAALITTETLNKLLDSHIKEQAKATILTVFAEKPRGYGRIIRNQQGYVERIVEEKDATEQERMIKEINSGTYCFDNRLLFETLELVSNSNSQGEYYLPDVIEILRDGGHLVSAYQTTSFEEGLGINSKADLALAENLLRKRINHTHMMNGVTIINPEHTYIAQDVVIGRDTVINPGTMIEGNTVIGDGCTIGPNSEIKDCHIGNYTNIRQSVAHQSKIGDNVSIGPFSHIRPDSAVGNDVRIGNFVEVKKSSFGNGSKASHLSYIGDAQVGENVNIGCGTITVNYDGKKKFQTIIEDDVFIGCNSNLIAPVTLKKGSYVAAGSTITHDVPEDALAIARARQTNKEGYAKRFKK